MDENYEKMIKNESTKERKTKMFCKDTRRSTDTFYAPR